LPEPPADRLKLIDKDNSVLPITKQCRLLNVNRSNIYYRPVPISDYDLLVMDKIDKIYTEMPFYGAPKITKHLRLNEGLRVNHKKIERLMAVMGISAIRPQRNTSRKHPQHPVFPYLLRRKKIFYPNQVWGSDITFIRGNGIWFYLTAVLDWHSRYVLSWW